jgi:hypothetical protein
MLLEEKYNLLYCLSTAKNLEIEFYLTFKSEQSLKTNVSRHTKGFLQTLCHLPIQTSLTNLLRVKPLVTKGQGLVHFLLAITVNLLPFFLSAVHCHWQQPF